MESAASKVATQGTLSEQLLSRLAQDRQRLVDFFVSRRGEFENALTQLANWANRLASAVQASTLALERREYELALRLGELDRREKLLEQLSGMVERRLTDWSLLQDQLRLQSELLLQRLNGVESGLSRGLGQLDDQLRQWSRVKAEIAARLEQSCTISRELGQQEGRLAAWQEELALREKSLAEKAQILSAKEARTHAQRRALLERVRSQRRWQKTPEWHTALPEEKSGQWGEILTQLQVLAEGQKKLLEIVDQLAALRGESASVSGALSYQSQSARGELGTTSGIPGWGDRHTLAESSGQAGFASDHADYARQYERACEEIRSLRLENELLAQKVKETQLSLEEARTALARGGGSASGTLSWEEQKQLLLNALEQENSAPSDAGKSAPRAQGELERALAEAQALLAEKDREILTLQKLLEEQSTHLGSLALGAAAIEELVAKDEIVQQERETARRIREEWEAKLRQAEVELSLERAKLARERAELEDRARQLAELAQELQKKTGGDLPGCDSAAAPLAQKSLRRRWFGQLGTSGDSHR